MSPTIQIPVNQAGACGVEAAIAATVASAVPTAASVEQRSWL